MQQRGRIPISMSWHVKTYIQAVQVTKAQLSLLRKTVEDKTSKATPRYHCSKQQCHCGAAALEALASCGSAHVGTWRLPQSFATVILEHTLCGYQIWHPKHKLWCGACHPDPTLSPSAGISLPPYCFSFHFISFYSFTFAFYLIRLADLAKEASSWRPPKAWSQWDKQKQHLQFSLYGTKMPGPPASARWPAGQRLEESEAGRKALFPQFFFASLYEYLSHLVLELAGTGSTNKTNENISRLFQTTILF